MDNSSKQVLLTFRKLVFGHAQHDHMVTTSYPFIEQGWEKHVYAQATIMMHAHPIRHHKIASLRWQSRSISVAYHVLSRYIASRQLHSIYLFVVSVPAKRFISAQPHNNIHTRMKVWSLGCMLNTSIYIPNIYILLYQNYPYVNTSIHTYKYAYTAISKLTHN